MTFARNPPTEGRGDFIPPARARFGPPEAGVTAGPESPAAREKTDGIHQPAFLDREAGTGPTPPEKLANVIAAGSKWKGSLTVQDSVRIDGHLTGEVNAKGTVLIAEGAVVEAKIKAAFVVVYGSFKGEILCTERLEVLPRSKVQGDLVTKVLNVHEGATIDGSIRMSSPEKAVESTDGPTQDNTRTRESEPAGLRAGRSLGGGASSG